eukprot:5398405-Pyramimonas_sp.AAC.1
MFQCPAPKCCGVPLSRAGAPVPPLKGSPHRLSTDSQYQVESFNGSFWTTLKRRLRESSAAFLCAQEVDTSADFVGRATARARSLGWHA